MWGRERGGAKVLERGRPWSRTSIVLMIALLFCCACPAVICGADADVAALEGQATEGKSVGAAYHLWRHYYLAGDIGAAETWWSKAKENAADVLVMDTTDAVKAPVETALVNAQWNRAATVLRHEGKTPDQRLAILSRMQSADPADPWVARALWKAKVAAKRPEAEVDAAWLATAGAIDKALADAQTEPAKALIRNRRLDTYHHRIQSVDERPDAAVLVRGLLGQMEGFMEGASTHARAFHARQMTQRYAALKEWPKTVEWAKAAAREHLALHANDKNREADMSIGYALNRYAAAAEKNPDLAPGLKAFADWAAPWVEDHGTLLTLNTRAGLFRAYDAAKEYEEGDLWHLRYLIAAFAQIAVTEEEKAREARWAAVEQVHRYRHVKQSALVKKDLNQRERVVAHADALRALLVARNDRLQIVRDVVYLYDAAGKTKKGSALFADLVAKTKAKIEDRANPDLERRLARVLAERIELLRYRYAEEERARLVAELKAFLRAHPNARVKSVTDALRQWRSDQ